LCHRSLQHQATPAAAYTTGIKAIPGTAQAAPSHDRVRTDRIDTSGVVTLRVAGKLRHIGNGRTHARTHVKLLIHDLDVTIINATTGENLRELTIDLTRDYQPPANHPAPQRNSPNPRSVGSGYSDVLRHHNVGLTGFEPATP
jgi:hypothetical protein